MTKEMGFFIYLLENYADKKGVRSKQVLEQWNLLGLTSIIYDMYDLYHVERLQNAFDDIDELVSAKQS
jgi:hypothetical protein